MQEGEKIVVSEQEFRRRFVYDQSTLLGEGGFAKVYQAYDRQFDETVALKFYTNTDAKKYDIISEMRSSRRFTHKNIIRVHDARIVRFTNSFGLTEDVQVGILEFANAGNLKDFLNTTPSEEEFKEVMKGILYGLHYLHTEKRVIHRDLSPDNILMVKEDGGWIPKIADFGISKQIDLKTLNMGNKKVSSELVGKMEYMAPEQFDPKKYGINGQIATNVDLWALGVILTEVFLESSPFGDRNTAQSPMQIMHNVLHHPLPSQIHDIPEPYAKIIKSCLVKDANRRAKSSLELIDMLTAVPTQKKRKANTIWMASVLVVLLLLAMGGWYFFIYTKEASKGKVSEASLVPEKEAESSLTPPLDSPLLSPDSTATDSDTEASHDNETEDDPESDSSGNLPSFDNEKPATVTLPSNVNSQKAALFKRLQYEINSLDNYIIDANLKMSRINTYIRESFINHQAKVLINENGNIEEQNIEDFFKYVVKTASIDEERSWRIDTLQTRLSGNKISVLHLKKY